MTTVDAEAVGLEAVRVARDLLVVRERELGPRFRFDKTFRSATTGGSLQWCIAFQPGRVSNPADTTDTPAPRVAAQLTFQRQDSERLLFDVHARHREIEEAVGHDLSWLPGGDAGRKLRSIVRSWRPLDAPAEELGQWMADEMLVLRQALQPVLRDLGLELP